MMLSNLARILNLRFLLFLTLIFIKLVWAFTKPYPWKEQVKKLMNAQTLFIGTIYLIMIIELVLPANSAIFIPLTPLIRYLGASIALTGMVLSVLGKLAMRNNWGEPGQHTIARQKYLVTTGVFEYTRNPIYVGLLMVYGGFHITLGSCALFFILPLYFVIRKTVLREEKLLTHHFGKQFTEYSKQSPRFL
jgi:protein-S-isoprenylcysteine O-methyltransferase Ste14